MAKINCNSCGKKLQIDETKLPMQEVKFACPNCKALILFHRGQYEEEAAVPPPPAGSPEAARPAAPAPAEPSPAAPPVASSLLGQPQALFVGTPQPALEAAVKSIGFSLRHVADAETARDIICSEHPLLVLLSPRQLTAPPLEEMAALTALVPADRRESFFVLVAPELRTGDGDTAFFYSVNLVLAPKDFGSFRPVYQEAYRAHQQSYKHFRAFRGRME